MAYTEKDELPFLSESFAERSGDGSSDPRRLSSRTRSVSMSGPTVSVEPYEREVRLVGHTGPLRSVRKYPFPQISGPLYATDGNGNLLQHSIVVTGDELVDNKTDKFPSFPGIAENDQNNNQDRRNEHLMRSGQLGMCNDPYCTTCPAYISAAQPRNPIRKANRFDPKFHNVLYGDAKGFARKVLSFFSLCIPGVMNPHTKVIQLWNKFMAILCLAAIFVDPFFYFLLYVEKKPICININPTLKIVLITLRSMNDIVYFLNILIQFRLAYVSPESRVVGAGELVDNPKDIARHYFLGYFFVDLFVVFPLPQIMVSYVMPYYLGSPEAMYSQTFLFAMTNVQYIPRLFRFIPLIMGQTRTGFIFESAWANFVINLVVVMLSGHVVGSCWYFFGLLRVDQCFQRACPKHIGCSIFIDCGGQISNLWIKNARVTACLNSTSGAIDYGIYAKAVPLIIETDIAKKYVYALFWGFQQVSTLAGNLVPAYYTLEVIFTMFIVGMGLFLFALLIGNIQNFLQALGQRRLEMQLRGRDVEKWMSHRHLPEDLRRRVRQAERYNWAATRGVNEEMLLESLPEDVQRDIRHHLFKLNKKVRIFSLMDEPVLDAICERLKQKIYIKGSKILSHGGLVEKMVFVVRGKLVSIGEDGNEVLLSDGDACGEELLTWYLEHSSVSKDGRKIRLPGQRLISNRTVRCLTNVEVFSLRAADLEEVTILFTRFLRSQRVQGALRYQSHYWRSLAATRIQVAWRYRKKRLSRRSATSPLDHQTLSL